MRRTIALQLKPDEIYEVAFNFNIVAEHSDEVTEIRNKNVTRMTGRQVASMLLSIPDFSTSNLKRIK